MAPKSKLNEEKVLDIRDLLKNGSNPVTLASVYKVSQRVIEDIRDRRTWKYVFKEE